MHVFRVSFLLRGFARHGVFLLRCRRVLLRGDYVYIAHEFAEEQLAAIDARRCPLYLLTGEYDYSCTTEGTLEVARRTGAQATIMKDLGHFPMSENPEKFIGYLLPVLEEIHAGRNAASTSHHQESIHRWPFPRRQKSRNPISPLKP